MIAPVDSMTRDELIEYVDKLENENHDLRLRTDNRHKLTAIEVRQIRQLADSGDYTYKEIADEYGVNPTTVYRTVIGDYHADVA